MDYIQPSFFMNKTVIGINRVYEFFPVDYVIIHHGCLGQEIIDGGLTLIVSKNDCCYPDKPNIYNGWYYQYNHVDKPAITLDLDLSYLDKDDSLVTGGSTAIDAMSFAYFLGAKNIILCGIDGGSINGKINFTGYYDYSKPGSFDHQVRHANRTRKIINEFADVLCYRGITVVSINPFTDLTLEGNRYETVEVKI